MGERDALPPVAAAPARRSAPPLPRARPVLDSKRGGNDRKERKRAATSSQLLLALQLLRRGGGASGHDPPMDRVEVREPSPAGVGGRSPPLGTSGLRRHTPQARLTRPSQPPVQTTKQGLPVARQ